MKTRSGRIAAAVAVVVIGIAVAMIAVTVQFGRSGRVCRGVTIAGLHVEGMTSAQAEKVVQTWAARRTAASITLTALDQHWTGSFDQLAIRIDVKDSVERAMAVGREGGMIARAWNVVGPGRSGKQIMPVIDLEPKEAGRRIERLARQIDRPHRNARIRVVEGRLEVVPDGAGIRVDREGALLAVATAARRGAGVISLPIHADEPDVTADDAAKITTLLARYTTPFNAGKVDRTHNLTLASRLISGTILKPGDRFSYNTTVGPRLMSRGFRNAPIFVKGKLEPGLGGGACQVSSTIYNAVLLSGLKIVERNHHSRTVPYVRPGRDATVVYGLLDFRFENSNASPVALITHIGGGRLTADIYGAPEDRKAVRIFTSQPKYVPSGTKTVVDGTVQPGKVKLVDHGSPGVSVTVYREVKTADGSAKTEIISRDRYPAQVKIRAIGRVVNAVPKATTSPST